VRYIFFSEGGEVGFGIMSFADKPGSKASERCERNKFNEEEEI
jgi:hypothetical protein